MADGVAELLAEVELFGGAVADVAHRLAATTRLRRLAAGSSLFRQGEPGDAAYIVASGRLELVLEQPPPERVVGVVGRGAVLGELAVLTGAARSATVRARRDSDVVELDGDALRTVLRDSPDTAMAMLRVLGTKLADTQMLQAMASRPPRTFAVVAGPGADADALARELVASLRRWGPTAVVDEAAAGDDPARALDRLELDHRSIVLVVPGRGLGPALDADRPGWWDFCLRQADRIVVAVSAPAEPRAAEPDPRLRGCELAVVGLGGAGAWLGRLEPNACHRLVASSDVARLARRLTGRAVGVVLSGGGARGLAHIGALRALLEAGVEIDRIGGCSMGAFVGSQWAFGRSPETIAATCRRELVERKPFNDFTIPRVALIRARKAEAMLRTVFGDDRLEDAPIDVFCVSADLAGAEVAVHRQGLARTAVAASMALPGLVPPVLDGGRVLVDGGVLDNLPVDVMDATGEGPVIAIDVMGRGRLGAGGRTRPSLIETLARATVLGSWRWVASTRDRAALVVEPDVSGIGLLEFVKLEQAVDAGYRAASIAIASRPDLVGG